MDLATTIYLSIAQSYLLLSNASINATLYIAKLALPVATHLYQTRDITIK